MLITALFVDMQRLNVGIRMCLLDSVVLSKIAILIEQSHMCVRLQWVYCIQTGHPSQMKNIYSACGRSLREHNRHCITFTGSSQAWDIFLNVHVGHFTSAYVAWGSSSSLCVWVAILSSWCCLCDYGEDIYRLSRHIIYYCDVALASSEMERIFIDSSTTTKTMSTSDHCKFNYTRH